MELMAGTKVGWCRDSNSYGEWMPMDLILPRFLKAAISFHF
jgi:hypothetical protein